MNDHDPDLREHFASLRRAEREGAPAFNHSLQGAGRRARSSRSTPGRPLWKWAASTAVAALVMAALTPLFNPRPSLTKVLPVLLSTPTKSEPLLAELTHPAGYSGSDFLLPLHLTIDPL